MADHAECDRSDSGCPACREDGEREMCEPMACGHAEANLIDIYVRFKSSDPEPHEYPKECSVCRELAQAIHGENRRAHDEILDVLDRLDSPSLKGAIPDKVRQLIAKARREQMEEDCKMSCARCKEGVMVYAFGGTWLHNLLAEHDGTSSTWSESCAATAIRARFQLDSKQGRRGAA